MKALIAAHHGGEIFNLCQVFDRMAIVGDNLGGWWDETTRPKPANLSVLTPEDVEERDWDVAIATNEQSLEAFKIYRLPLIFMECVMRPAVIPGRDWRPLVDRYVFHSVEARRRWQMPDTLARVIEHGFDVDLWSGWNRYCGDRALMVGYNLPARLEKGAKLILDMPSDLSNQITLCGDGNNVPAQPYHRIKPQSFTDLLSIYRSHRAYLNPSRLVTMSTIEAMLVGLPIVTFQSENMADLFIHEWNAYVATSEQDWFAGVRRVLSDHDFGAGIAYWARQDAVARFGISRYAREWRNAVMELL